jgi:hypothetical protein
MDQGAENITATATDTSGNTTTSAAKSITIDTIAPSTPTVNTLITNDTTPVITGTTGTGSALAADETLTVKISEATYTLAPTRIRCGCCDILSTLIHNCNISINEPVTPCCTVNSSHSSVNAN